ncbi:vitamin B12 transporter [Caulobacter ginsengisoli]|uniref:Vitamin B12 transporter n=1 Tax=Caulobacter ginsengisoli TaxID=400775 RepID=A0ABU0IS81_9CAUL|nr:TonB-dependent receptor [Caulobacter ginsengisoli]MDQ0464872.1 vitamin B12 transporter [Caulobacter ginsengisoli]
MKRLLLTTALVLAPAAAFADTDVSEVIVTAERLPSTLDQTPDARVITRDEIDRRQAVFAADILTTVPGLSLSRNGGFGGFTSVKLRGAASDKTLVLIDGVVQNDASSPNGGYDFSSLDLDDVSQVEILSGPQGSIWGSDAIGGVVSFTTRDLDGLRASLEGGSYSTVHGSAAIGQVNAASAISASVSAYRTDGVSKAANGTEDDGFKSWTAGVRARIDLTDTVRLDGQVRYNEADADVDGYDAFFTFGDTTDRSKNRSWTGFARVRADQFLGLDQSLSVSLYDLTRDSISAFPSSYDARRATWRWTGGRGGASDPFAFLLGIERDDTEASISTGATSDLGATSVFAMARFSPVDAVSVTASLRYDDPDKFSGKATARIGATARLPAGFTAAASFGQGFKTPTISQTVCDFCFPAGPSTGLKPETAQGWDASLHWRSADDRYFVRVTGYRLEVKDQISYGVGRYVNIDRTLTTGVEAEAEAEVTDQLSIKVAYAFTDAVDRATGAELLRVPAQSGSVALWWTGDRLSGALTVRAEGEQADSDPSTFSPATRDGFTVADLSAGWKLNDQVEITGRIENLTDETYSESLGYGETGRAVYVGVRLKR